MAAQSTSALQLAQAIIAAAGSATTTMAATTTARPTTTMAPTTTAAPMGLGSGSVPAGYVQYPTYGDKGFIHGRDNTFETSAFPGAPAKAADSGTGSGASRWSYYVATTAAPGGKSPEQGPGGSSTGPMIGTPVVITGGPIPAGSVFRTKVDSYTTANDMTWGGYRYGSYTFSPEPPNNDAYSGAYKFFFAPTVKGGRRRRGSRGRKGRKGTRRH